MAQRISGFTTKCLLTGIVLVAALGFGRQVLRWWAGDSPAPPGAVVEAGPDPLGDPSQPHRVRFGDQPWSLGRQTIAGDRRAAGAALRAACRRVIGEVPLPGDPASQAELELVGRLAQRRPIDESPGRWQLYQLDEGLPMIVGSRTPPVCETPKGPDGVPPQTPPAASAARSNLAVAVPRVVTWGLAMPMGPGAWSVCTFQPEAGSREGVEGGPELPVPPDCRRILSLDVAGGGAMVGFRGSRRPKTWIAFYDHWFAEHNWKAAGPWRDTGSAWHNRYLAPPEAPSASADVHFGAEGRDRLSGLLMIAPKAVEGGGRNGVSPRGEGEEERPSPPAPLPPAGEGRPLEHQDAPAGEGSPTEHVHDAPGN